MSTTPKSRRATLAFYSVRADPWGAHAAELGLSPERLADLEAALAQAQAAHAAAREAQAAARAATLAFNQALATLKARGSQALAIIRTRAASLQDPSLYTLAEIDPPRGARAPIDPVPAADVRGTLAPDGAVTLRWKAGRGAPPEGNFYMVERRVQTPAGLTRWENAGVSTRRHFTDAATPAGALAVQYRVRTHRVGRTSAASDICTVAMGVVAGAGEGEARGRAAA